MDGLAARGHAVMHDAMPGSVNDGLSRRACALDGAGRFAPARVGRAGHRASRSDIRGDRTAWLDDAPDDEAERALGAWLEALRLRCNRELMLGLADVEAHYAIYPAGAHYERHRDRFRDDDARVLSCVLYLNDAWSAADGGALRLHMADGTTQDVLPQGGTLVFFANGRVLSGGCDVPPHVVDAMRAELAKLSPSEPSPR